MKADQVKQSRQEVNLTVGDSELTMYLQDQAVIFEIDNYVTIQSFKLELTPQKLDQSSNLSFCFSQPYDLLKHLSGNPQKLTISDNGLIQINVNILENLRKIKIQTNKVEMTEKELLNKVLQALLMRSKQYKEVKQDLNEMKEKMNKKEQETKQMKSSDTQLQLMSIQMKSMDIQMKQMKEEIKEIKEKFNVIQLKELKELKRNFSKIQEKIELLEKDQLFWVDPNNQHYSLFDKIKNRIKKREGDSYQTIFGKQLIPNSSFTFKVKQMKGTDIMYGVGSNQIRGRNNSYDKVGECALYFSYKTGYLFPGAVQLKENGVQNGETVEIVIDTANWKVTWKKNGTQLATSVIPEKIRKEPLFPVIYMHVVGDEIEFV